MSLDLDLAHALWALVVVLGAQCLALLKVLWKFDRRLFRLELQFSKGKETTL